MGVDMEHCAAAQVDSNYLDNQSVLYSMMFVKLDQYSFLLLQFRQSSSSSIAI